MRLLYVFFFIACDRLDLPYCSHCTPTTCVFNGQTRTKTYIPFVALFDSSSFVVFFLKFAERNRREKVDRCCPMENSFTG